MAATAERRARRGEEGADEASPNCPEGEDDGHRHRCRSCVAQAVIDRRTRAEVKRICDRRRASKDRTKRKLAGAGAVTSASRTRRGNHHYGRLNPRFKSRDPDRMERAIEEHRVLLASHEAAKQRFASGEARVVFPSGTYGYRELFGVRVAKGGAAA